MPSTALGPNERQKLAGVALRLQSGQAHPRLCKPVKPERRRAHKFEEDKKQGSFLYQTPVDSINCRVLVRSYIGYGENNKSVDRDSTCLEPSLSRLLGPGAAF